MASNPYYNQLGALGQVAGTATTPAITSYPSGIVTWPPAAVSIFPHTTMPTVGNFRVTKIANGFLVDIVKFEGGQVETHHVEGFREAGELITAMCVRWELEGRK